MAPSITYASMELDKAHASCRSRIDYIQEWQKHPGMAKRMDQAMKTENTNADRNRATNYYSRYHAMLCRE
jgi:hypothetical protein